MSILPSGASASRAAPFSALLIASTCALVAALTATPARAAGLSYADAVALAQQNSPGLRGAEAAVAGAQAAQGSAASLPDPRWSAGLDNLPVAGPDRWSTTRDTGTMQRLALMQEVPNQAKREARARAAQAQVERERAALALATLVVRRDAALAWLAAYHAERRQALLADARRENQMLQDTLPQRIASGRAGAFELTMARQDALALADRGDELAREVRRARAELRRWVGVRADEPLAGVPELATVSAEAVRRDMPRHAELSAYAPMRAAAAAELAEADAERRGDWSWQVMYSRRPRYDDMISFQLSFDLPWQRERRQQSTIDARRKAAERVEAEREDAVRRHAAEVEAQLAEAQALDSQLARASGPALALAADRVRLALAGYEAGRADLGAVLAARAQAVEVRLRIVELEAQRDALRVRLTTLSAE